VVCLCGVQGFYIRAVPSKYNPGTLNLFEAKKVTVKAGMAFTVGLRLFYLFIPLVSVVVTAAPLPPFIPLLHPFCIGS
jgi:hypothetical protein